MTEEELIKLAALETKATPGPWMPGENWQIEAAKEWCTPLHDKFNARAIATFSSPGYHHTAVNNKELVCALRNNAKELIAAARKSVEIARQNREQHAVLSGLIDQRHADISMLQAENAKLKETISSGSDAIIGHVAGRVANKKLQDENAKLKALLRRVEWFTQDNGYRRCDICGRIEYQDHAPGCEIAEALRDE